MPRRHERANVVQQQKGAPQPSETPAVRGRTEQGWGAAACCHKAVHPQRCSVLRSVMRRGPARTREEGMNRAKEVGHLGGEHRPDSQGREPWPGGSRGKPGPRHPRHLEWLPAAAAPAGTVAAAGGRSVVPTSQTAPTMEARCVPATCVRLAYTVSCIVTEGAKGREGRGGQGGQRGQEATGGCSATCVPLAQGPGHQRAER